MFVFNIFSLVITHKAWYLSAEVQASKSFRCN